MHPGILSAGIENEGRWPWPSKTFWPFWLRILGNPACPCDNSSQVLARITKFAPNMHPGILSAGIENGSLWPWLGGVGVGCGVWVWGVGCGRGGGIIIFGDKDAEKILIKTQIKEQQGWGVVSYSSLSITNVVASTRSGDVISRDRPSWPEAASQWGRTQCLPSPEW